MNLKTIMLKFQPERAFLGVALIFGLLLLFITPPFQTPDAPQHFLRGYAVSSLQLVSTLNSGHAGSILPKSLVITAQRASGNVPHNSKNKVDLRTNKQLLGTPLAPDDTAFIFFDQSALYSPVPYLPQAIGITLGKILTFSPLAIMYLARITNLAVWVLLCFIAIKITPVAKWTFFLIALTPMSLFMAASISPDAFTNALAFLVVALFLKYSIADTENILKVKQLGFLVAVATLLCLSKLVYCFIPLLLIFISSTRFRSRSTQLCFISIFIITWVATNLIWFNIGKGLYTPAAAFISPSDQLQFIANNPMEYVRIMLITSRALWRYWLYAFVGHLGWMDTEMPDIISVCYFWILMLAVIAGDIKKNILGNIKKVLIALTFAASFTMIFTGIYTSWAQVGYIGVISAIQGRYFIPLAPLFFLLFYNLAEPFLKFFSREKLAFVIGVLAFLFSIFCLSVTVRVLILRYY